jgi:BolA protein
MDRRSHIETKLREGLDALHVDVVDESHLHAGHAGAASGGGHFRAVIVSAAFEGENRVARQRRVFGLLVDEMKQEIHALSMKTFTPYEWRETEGGS